VKKHPTETEMDAYRNRTASPEQLLAINDHIFECDQCFRLVDSPEKVQAAYEAANKYVLLGVEHLDYNQVEGYVDGTLDVEKRESVAVHIKDCKECAREVREIAELKARIEADVKSRTTLPKLAAFLKMPVNLLTVGLAFLVIVCVLVFWAHAHRMNLQVAAMESAMARIDQSVNDLRRQIEGISAKRPGGAPLALKDGNRQILIDEKGELLGFDTLAANYRDALKDALTAGSITILPPPETTLGQKGSTLGSRPQGRTFEALSPAGTAVEDTRPVFEWQPLAGATSYTVFVKDLATGSEIEGQPTGRTTWTSDKPLVRGHQYAWMVEAAIDGQRVRAPAPEKPFATFRILDEQEAREISLARKAWGSSHLVMGLVYARTGLAREAEKEFRELVAANPESSTARSLLASVEAKTISGRR
jgi:hypothetical protein